MRNWRGNLFASIIAVIMFFSFDYMWDNADEYGRRAIFYWFFAVSLGQSVYYNVKGDALRETIADLKKTIARLKGKEPVKEEPENDAKNGPEN